MIDKGLSNDRTGLQRTSFFPEPKISRVRFGDFARRSDFLLCVSGTDHPIRATPASHPPFLCPFFPSWLLIAFRKGALRKGAKTVARSGEARLIQLLSPKCTRQRMASPLPSALRRRLLELLERKMVLKFDYSIFFLKKKEQF